MRLFDLRYKPPGTRPGSLDTHPSHPEPDGHMQLYLRKPSGESSLASIDSSTLAAGKVAVDELAWLHVQGRLEADTLQLIGAEFDMHDLALEDIHDANRHSKIESYAGQLFIVLNLPRYEDGRMQIDQVSLLLAGQHVLSVCDGPDDPFEPVRRRLLRSGSQLQQRGADFLLYALIDCIVDQGFPVLEAQGDELEQLEEQVLSNASQDALPRLHRIRRELILLRRRLWPQRDVIASLLHGDHHAIDEQTRVYLRDCHDHAVQIMDLVESYRDMGYSLLDIYLSSVSNRLNETMRVLTLIATIFIPLTFIAGVYGMNFDRSASPWAMPELGWYYGYPLVWGLMIAIAVGMLIWFKRRHWF